MNNAASIEETGKPFSYKGGKVGVLLIHGFTGTPFVFRELGQQLAREGYTVLAPILAGHGTSPEDMEKTTWRDWYSSAEAAFDQLAVTCNSIFIIGASLGSNLACQLSTQRKVSGLVLIGMPRWIHRQWFIVKILMPVLTVLGFRFFDKSITNRSFRRMVFDGALLGGPTHSYYKIPIKSVHEFLDITGSQTDDILPKITAPTLIVQSTNDGLVHPESGQYIFDTIASEEKELVWIEEPHDRLHSGKERRRIYQHIISFIVR